MILVHSWSFAVDTRIGNRNMCTIVSAVAQLWAETLLKTSATAAGIATATIATTSKKTATTVTNNSSNKQPKAKQQHQQQQQQQEHHY